jgi:pectate lyase C
MIRPLITVTICLFAGLADAQSVPTTAGSTCVSTGTVEVTKTILVASGTFDGGCKTYVPRYMNADSTGEETARMALLFKVENGARLRNIIIDHGRAATARAIEIRNGATLENVRIAYAFGDRYIAVRTTGTVNIDRITAIGNASLQRHIHVVGADTAVKISNCIFTNADQVYRQNGATTYATHVSIDRCDVSNIRGELMRTDSPLSTAALTNSRLHGVKTICLGYAPGQCRLANNVVY